MSALGKFEYFVPRILATCRDDGGGRATRVVPELARPHQHPSCRNAGPRDQLRNHDGPSTGMGSPRHRRSGEARWPRQPL